MLSESSWPDEPLEPLMAASLKDNVKDGPNDWLALELAASVDCVLVWLETGLT